MAEVAQQLGRFLALAAFTGLVGALSHPVLGMASGGALIYAHESGQHGLIKMWRFRRDVVVGWTGVLVGGGACAWIA